VHVVPTNQRERRIRSAFDSHFDILAHGVAMRTMVLVLLLAVAGCRTPAPVYNVNDAPIASSRANPALDDVAAAIQRGGTSLGWRMDRVQPGLIYGTLQVRSHVAIVSVIFNTTHYTIRYRDSTGLGYDGESIHPNYNGWVKRLDEAIRAQLVAF
jgi:hypothetical protein